MPEHPDLQDEQEFLNRAYDGLEFMRGEARQMLQGVLDLGRGGTFQSRTERDIVVRTSLARLEQLDIGDQALYFGRIDRLPEPGMEPTSRRTRCWASRSTSAGSPSRAPTTNRWSSTGAPRWRSPSTGPPASTHRGSPAAATSPSGAGRSSGSRMSTSSTPKAAPARPPRPGPVARQIRDGGERLLSDGLVLGGPGALLLRWVRPGRAAWATSSRRSSASRTRSSARRCPGCSWSRVGPAPARPRWRCTVPPTSSTRTASRWSARACSSSVRTRCSCATSSRSCPRSARPGSACRPWRGWCPRCASAASTTPPWPS